MHVLLSESFFGPGQQSAYRACVEVERRGEFDVAEPLRPQENQGDLVRLQRTEDLPHARPLFGLLQHLMGLAANPNTEPSVS